jgi:NUMOD3 motif
LHHLTGSNLNDRTSIELATQQLAHVDARMHRIFSLYWLRDETCTNIAEHGYVGVTCRPKDRETEHRRRQRFPPGFVMDIIFTGSQPECMERERTLRPEPGIGWNLAVGGPWGFRYGHSEETRKKIAETSKQRSEYHDIGDRMRGKKQSPEHTAKIRAALTGKKASAETREKLRQSHLGQKLSDEHRAKIGAANRGRKFSPETIEKIKAAQGNRTPEHREKLSASQRGRKRNPESVEKAAAARRGKPWSEAARAAHAGRRWSEETRAKMADHIKSLADAKRGKPRSPETIEKIRAAAARKRLAAP